VTSIAIPHELAAALRHAGARERMEVLLRHFDGSLEWFRALGRHWSTCDTIGLHRHQVANVLSRATPEQRLAMMEAVELATWATLPPVFTVWRGAHAVNADGLSWSLDREVAARFPFLPGYARQGEAPLLLTGCVRRSDCILKLDRRESEIIAPRVQIVDRRHLVHDARPEATPPITPPAVRPSVAARAAALLRAVLSGDRGNPEAVA